MKEVDKEIENLIPKNLDNWLDDIFGKSRWAYDVGACENTVIRPMWDLLGRGGKRWRPFLMNLCYEVVGGEENIDRFLPIVEVIHNGTLIIDDIEDSSDCRRGAPCIHKIYGDDIAINAGNAMYYLPMLSVIKSNLDLKTKVKIYEIVSEEMIKLSFGQGMDIFWHKGGSMPSEDEYLQMCAFKTGTLARMAAKLGAILALGGHDSGEPGGASDDVVNALGEFAESLGVAFQIQDDILNIVAEDSLGKDFGDDISEGKRSLLVICALDVLVGNEAKILVDILDSKTKDKVLIGKAINILKDSGAVEYSSKVARDLIVDAWEKLNIILTDCEAKSKLKMFVDFIVERDLR